MPKLRDDLGVEPGYRGFDYSFLFFMETNRRDGIIEWKQLGCYQMVIVLNPYRYVDWDSTRQYKSNLHCHTQLHKLEDDGSIVEYAPETEVYEKSDGRVYGSDGTYLPHVVIDKYKEYGFSILALTDHDPFLHQSYQDQYSKETTYPWSLWGRVAEELDMIAVEGKELSNPTSVDYEHDVSLFNSLGALDQSQGYDRIERLNNVADNMGLISLAHPKNHVSADELALQIRRYNISLLIEVFCRADKTDARKFWDNVLEKTMPFLPVWGISVDDMHHFEQLGTNWSAHLLSEFNVEAVRHSLIRGEHYFCLDPQGNNSYRHNPVRAPVINRIEANNQEINIICENTANIFWISEGRQVFAGDTLDLRKIIVGNYVRAELTGNHGEITCTQPFGIIHDEETI